MISTHNKVPGTFQVPGTWACSTVEYLAHDEVWRSSRSKARLAPLLFEKIPPYSIRMNSYTCFQHNGAADNPPATGHARPAPPRDPLQMQKHRCFRAPIGAVGSSEWLARPLTHAKETLLPPTEQRSCFRLSETATCRRGRCIQFG